MRNNTPIILVFCLGIVVAWLEAIWIFPWLWLLFLPLIWRLKLKAESWWGLAFGLGLIRDLFWGGFLGKSSFLFLLGVAVFYRLTDSYHKRTNLLS
ncbi:rod shape-determining protein MreD [Candidatus Shapirobacteria bacterium]|nr:rod shape-determining protein MreD [Candidatus Shapirobacteria bacterium]